MFLSKYLEKKGNFTQLTIRILFEVIVNEGKIAVPRDYRELQTRLGIDEKTIQLEIESLIKAGYISIDNDRIKSEERLWIGLS